MIKFNIDYPGFTAGREYEAKYCQHPVFGYITLRVRDDDGDIRYIDPTLTLDGSIVEVDSEECEDD